MNNEIRSVPDSKFIASRIVAPYTKLIRKVKSNWRKCAYCGAKKPAKHETDCTRYKEED